MKKKLLLSLFVFDKFPMVFRFLHNHTFLHFLKVYIPPYSTDEARMLRDSWFVNICGANIGLFPFLFFSKNKHVKDYMFYIGVLSGLIALFYPQEPRRRRINWPSNGISSASTITIGWCWLCPC